MLVSGVLRLTRFGDNSEAYYFVLCARGVGAAIARAGQVQGAVIDPVPTVYYRKTCRGTEDGEPASGTKQGEQFIIMA